jgi:hypothetical protein
MRGAPNTGKGLFGEQNKPASCRKLNFFLQLKNTTKKQP